MEKERKICSRCQDEQDINQFGIYKNRGKVYHRCTCNSCRRKAEAERYIRDPKAKERMTKATRKSQLKTYYGITEEDYERMFKEQEGKCAICGLTSKKKLNIDHCHISGKVRGLLCWNCNIGLGYFKDNLENLQNAIKYLQ